MNQKILNFLLVCSIVFFSLDIALAVFSLAGVWRGECVPLVSRMSNLICQGNFIVGMLISLALLFGQYIFVAKCAYRMSEVAARFALDSMAQRFFEVDSMLNSGKMSVVEAEKMRERIRNEAEYYSALDGSTRLLVGTAKANMILCAVIFAGAVAIEIFAHGKARLQAVESAVFLVAGNVPLFVLPVAIVSLFAGASASSK